MFSDREESDVDMVLFTFNLLWKAERRVKLQSANLGRMYFLTWSFTNAQSANTS